VLEGALAHLSLRTDASLQIACQGFVRGGRRMQEISFETGVAATLDSLIGDQLALLAGAGLSMAAPSSLPSAAALAAFAKQKYDALYGTTRPHLPADVEDQAEFFF